MPGKIYKDLESLDVLEQLGNESYDFIFLDVPYFSGFNDFDLISDEIKLRISKMKNIPIGEITANLIREERENIEKAELKEYSGYISKVVENVHRLLKDDGVLAFLCPSHEYVDINYRLILDQFFPSFAVVTIEKNRSLFSKNHGNNYSLFFYSKKKDFVIPELKELSPVEEFPYRDEYDHYRKIPAAIIGRDRPNLHYEWHGITPAVNKTWKYRREKMDEMFSQGRIIIEDDKVWIKYYRGENPKPISSVWKYTDTTGFLMSIDSTSIGRMFSMFVKSGSRVLCPYDRDGKFSYFADISDTAWESVYLGKNERNMIVRIPEEHYEVIEDLDLSVSREYKDDIVTNVGDIDGVKEKLNKLAADVKTIQSSIGLDDDSELSVKSVTDKIHQAVTEVLSAYNIDGCIPEAEAWLDPYWHKLEPESKHFIPTGLLLYNQFNADPGIDQAPIMIEYCKSLEKELFQKMYYGYIKDLMDRGTDIRSEFPEAFDQQSTSVFAEFLSECTTTKKDDPEEWKFEMGKMAYVLQAVLGRSPREPIIIDFRDYLNRVFDQQFFMEKFNDKLHIITKLRNNCAHPNIINKEAVETGKELIRQKLLLILKYYTE